MGERNLNNLKLNNGSKIAVIGGGPAGSFFSLFTLDLAGGMGMSITVDLYETKNFSKVGPSGCNHCGGIVSETLLQALSYEGIVLPADVVRRGIETYTLHLEQGSTVIRTPYQEQRIASMFRGAGPNGSNNPSRKSFDGFLLDLCKSKGAGIHYERVKDLEYVEDGIKLCTDNKERIYDLVVGASGLNARTFDIFKKLMPSYKPPGTTKTFICEYLLGQADIDTYFGNSMHVYLLNIPQIKFGALIPKGDYVTLVLLGDSIDRKAVDEFIDSVFVKSCFPPDTNLKSVNSCQCFPSINIKSARHAFNDRVVMIGDTSSTKLYKNGIGAAYITAKSAAKTVVFDGISKKDFERSYQPTCSKLNRDNSIGKLIFWITIIIQKSQILKKGLFRMVVEEQKRENNAKKMSSILWDTFTGSATYSSILRRTIHPVMLIRLIWNIFIASFKFKINQK